MKNNFLMPVLLIMIILSSFNCSKKMGSENVLLSDFNTIRNVVPFDKISIDDYLPAVDSLIKLTRLEIDEILANRDEPDFVNTIEALDRCGERLNRVSIIFFNLVGANTSDTMQQLAQQISPMLTEFQNDVFLNDKLFDKVRTVCQKKDQYNLNPEQQMLLDETYQSFIRQGANLNEEDKKKFREITTELSRLTLIFDDNVLNETNAFQLHITDEKDLAGLPENAVEAAALTARSKDLDGWIFTLQYPSYLPFMQYADNRDLREQMYKAYSSKGFHGNERDNRKNIKRITELRLQLANILGYETYADYVLERRMAENMQRVNAFLDELLDASMPFAKKEYNEVQEYAKSLGADFQLMRWDWAYYSEKLKKEKFNVDDEMTRPYFQLENVQKGIFELASTLYGITFKKNSKIPVYHPEVTAYEIFDRDGSFLAVLYTDFFPRDSKQGGAWATTYRNQFKIDGQNIRPHASMVFNFTKPTETKPSLLTFDQVTTFLHEFGHALHAVFSDCTYSGLSSFNVYWDFVELPSQIMENFAEQKEWLDKIAVHYKTGEPIPDTLLDNIIESRNFQSGYSFVRQITFGLNDMAWHSITSPVEVPVEVFEREAIASTELFPPVEDCLISTQFSHIFSGGYAAGYYSYKWAEVLEADAFSLFKENGVFDQATAQSFRDNILSKGATEHPLELYKRFRGREPKIDALLENRGLVEEKI
ncbi:MAG: M3 family metallopeptidase [Bacteroidales bacterium]|nr:M3 family metallopeptidase [Bacteroidales bacterium]